MVSRPVAALATRTASMVASVPEFTYRIRSTSRACSRAAISRARAVIRSTSASTAMSAPFKAEAGHEHSCLSALDDDARDRQQQPHGEDERAEHEDLGRDADPNGSVHP